MKKVIQTGEWGGQPIWREQTPEETLQEVGIKPDEAMTYLALLANKDNRKLSQNHIDNCNGCALCEI